MNLEEHKDLLKQMKIELTRLEAQEKDISEKKINRQAVLEPKPLKSVCYGLGRFVSKCWYEFGYKLRESLVISEVDACECVWA